MKRIGSVLLWAALTSVGCLPAMFQRQEEKPPPVKVEDPPPPAVTADGISEKNAANRAWELRQELEYDLTHKQQPATKTPAEK